MARPTDTPAGGPVAASLKVNIQYLEQTFHMPLNRDPVLAEFDCADFRVCLVYLDGMADRKGLERAVIEPIRLLGIFPEDLPGSQRAEFLKDHILFNGDMTLVEERSEIPRAVVDGRAALLIDGCPRALVFEVRGYEKRQVADSSVEAVVLGPQEAYVENVRSNITLVRRILHTPDLVTEIHSVGDAIPTTIAILYLDDLVNRDALEELKRRINALDVDRVEGLGELEQLLEDNSHSMLPQSLLTERPDRTCASLADGQIAVFLEGSPLALIAPISFFHLIHSPDDMFMRWPYALAIRSLRVVALLIAMLLPAIFLAITMYHHNSIPFSLIASIAETHSRVSYPMLVEMIIMEGAFFLINEAGMRIPRSIGPSVSIVGGLIMGQAAVSAQLVSPALIVIVALSGLGTFSVPNYSLTHGIMLIRFFMIGVAALGGFLGISLAMCALCALGCATHSLGQPLFAPIAPFRPHSGDIVLRRTRPRQSRRYYLAQRQKRR